MKILALLLLLNVGFVIAQNDKPSWHEEMPERNDAPELDMDLDTGLDTDMDLDLGLDRDDESEEQNSDEQQKEQERIAAEKKAEEERLEQERIAAEKKAEEERLEQERIAAEKKAEEERQEQERIAAEKKAEDDRQEQQRIAEEEKQAQEKQRAQKDAEAEANKIAEENATSDTQQPSESTTVTTNSGDYPWIKVRNVLPEYPPRAARSNKEGWVDVELTVNSSGQVISAKAVGSYRNQDTFIDAALEAVRQWEFEAPSAYGINNSLSKEVRIVFQL